MREKDINAAWQAYYRGDMETARSILEPGLAGQPGNTGAMVCLSAVYLAEDDIEPALALITRAVELNPEDKNVWVIVGMLYNRIGHYEDAVDAFEHAMEVTPDSTGVNFYLGVAQRNAGLFSEALRNLDIYRRDYPDDPLGTRELARTYHENSQPVRALELYREAIEQGGNEAEIRAEMGDLLRKMGHYDEAREELRKAFLLDRKCAYAHFVAGVLYYETADYDNADRSFAETIAIRPDNFAAWRLYVLNAHKRGDTHAVQGRLLQLLERFPEMEDELKSDDEIRGVI